MLVYGHTCILLFFPLSKKKKSCSVKIWILHINIESQNNKHRFNEGYSALSFSLSFSYFLISHQFPHIGFLLLVCLTFHFSLFRWTFGRSIIRHNQCPSTRDSLCLSCSSAASECAQSHRRTQKKKKKRKKEVKQTDAACQAAVTSCWKRHLSIKRRRLGRRGKAAPGNIRLKEEEELV